MAISIDLTFAEPNADRARACELPADEAALLAEPDARQAHTTVLLLSVPAPDPAADHLIVSPSDLEVLTVGSDDRAVAVFAHMGTNDATEPAAVDPADEVFLDELARVPSVEPVGKALLTAVRRNHGGRFQRIPRGNWGLFVQRPDNFWTVIVQPRAVALKITVRGEPERFSDFQFDIRADQHGYSRFKLKTVDEVDDALALLARAARHTLP